MTNNVAIILMYGMGALSIHSVMTLVNTHCLRKLHAVAVMSMKPVHEIFFTDETGFRTKTCFTMYCAMPFFFFFFLLKKKKKNQQQTAVDLNLLGFLVTAIATCLLRPLSASLGFK